MQILEMWKHTSQIDPLPQAEPKDILCMRPYPAVPLASTTSNSPIVPLPSTLTKEQMPFLIWQPSMGELMVMQTTRGIINQKNLRNRIIFS